MRRNRVGTRNGDRDSHALVRCRGGIPYGVLLLEPVDSCRRPHGAVGEGGDGGHDGRMLSRCRRGSPHRPLLLDARPGALLCGTVCGRGGPKPVGRRRGLPHRPFLVKLLLDFRSFAHGALVGGDHDGETLRHAGREWRLISSGRRRS